MCAQGVWNQIDSNMLPTKCSYGACTTCPKYGEFPCAWYKIVFVVIGLVGQYMTRTLYTEAEVAYARKAGGNSQQHCSHCGWCCGGGDE